MVVSSPVASQFMLLLKCWPLVAASEFLPLETDMALAVDEGVDEEVSEGVYEAVDETVDEATARSSGDHRDDVFSERCCSLR
jgi:hypothetical protein